MPSNKSTIDTYLEFHYQGQDVKKAASDVKAFESAGKDAGAGISILDLSLGNLAANGVQSIISGAGQAVGALAQWGAESAELASDARETESLLNSALGPAYQGFADNVSAVADATGRSSREFKQAVSPILAMTKAQGFSADEAARTSVAFGEAALDLNSYFNSATGFEDLQSAISGSADTMQKYGVNVKEGALQQAALKAGLIDTLGPLDTATRTTVLLAEVQRQAADAMGDATRTSGEYANTQRALTDTFGDFKAEVGDSIVSALEPLQKKLLSVSKSGLPDVAEGLTLIIDRAGKASLGLVQVGDRVTTAFSGAESFAIFDRIEQFNNTAVGGILGNAINPLAGVADTAGDAFNYLEQLGEVEAAEARLIEARSTGGGGRGGRGSFGFDVATVEVQSFDVALQSTNNTLQNLNIGDAFGNFSVDQSSLDSFFGTIDSSTQSTIDSFQKIGSAIGEVQAKLDGLGTADIVSIGGNAEDDALDAFASGLGSRGVSIADQATALTAAGESLEEVNTRVKDLLEQGAADVALAYIDAGKPVEEAIALLEGFQEQIDSSDNPISLATDGTLGLQEALTELGASTFAPQVEFQVSGLEDLERGIALLNQATGGNADIGAVLDSSLAPDRGIAATANRRQ